MSAAKADLETLSATDRALVAHLRRTYDEADGALRERLVRINEDQLAEAKQTRLQALRMLAAADRAIAMREAWLSPHDGLGAS